MEIEIELLVDKSEIDKQGQQLWPTWLSRKHKLHPTIISRWHSDLALLVC